MNKLKQIIQSVVAEVRLTSDKSSITLGNITKEEFEIIRDNKTNIDYHFSNGQDGTLWEFVYGIILTKLNYRQVANIVNVTHNRDDDKYIEMLQHQATDVILNSYDDFKYLVKYLGLEDIQISKNIEEVRLKQGGTEKQDKIVSYQETGGPHDFFRYWKDDSHSNDVLYYTMSDESTWSGEQEEKFEVFKSTENGFTMIFTNLDEKDATQLAYKQAMDDPNGKFVKWNMSYSRFDLPI
jgi:hypothetical protein